MKNIILIIISIYISGCNLDPIIHPNKMANSTTAFSTNNANIPSESHLKATYAASYEDVFHALTSSIPLVQIFPEKIEKSKGYIFGVRTKKVGREQYEVRYLYRIRVKELRAESTSVDVQTKVQSECPTVNTGIGWYITTFGIVAALESAGGKEEYERRCLDYLSKPNWSAGERDDVETMQKLHNMIRVNLVQAGVL